MMNILFHEHKSIEYLITSICGTSKSIKPLKFVEDSAVKTIYEYALLNSPIEEINLPTNLKELKEKLQFPHQIINSK